MLHKLSNKTVTSLWLVNGNGYTLCFLFLDCMDITLQTMLQSILQRNPLRTTDSSSSAQIEELTEDGQCVNIIIELLKRTFMHIPSHV